MISTIGFLTRIPVKTSSKFDPNFNKSIVYFPFVGLILGIIYFMTLYIGNIIFGSFVGGIFTVTATVFLTGGLHLDGLGDTFDGLYSNRDKERILEIMKDSRLGTNALLGIMINLILKIGMIDLLVKNNMLYVILIMPIVGRLALCLSCYKGKPAREQGMGNVFIGKIQKKDFIITMISGFGFIFLYTISFYNLMIFFLTAISALIVVTIVYFYRNHVYKKIDGITGDILGAICELSETLYLIVLFLGVKIWLSI
ncbi:adenosylcobinamide-GDP ribazoletransferase [Acetoanaerobium pronyense]|nr:adenosylcobinamide-GDP ribazoletransferase [Acetoanaerobium pronyense]